MSQKKIPAPRLTPLAAAVIATLVAVPLGSVIGLLL